MIEHWLIRSFAWKNRTLALTFLSYQQYLMYLTKRKMIIWKSYIVPQTKIISNEFFSQIGASFVEKLKKRSWTKTAALFQYKNQKTIYQKMSDHKFSLVGTNLTWFIYPNRQFFNFLFCAWNLTIE